MRHSFSNLALLAMLVAACGEGGDSGQVGARDGGATGGATGTQCRTNADCPALGCFMCPGSMCVNGQCVSTGGSGNGGSSGSGGAAVGGTGGASSTSPGTVTIDFTVTGASYCVQSRCGEGPSIDIEDASGHSLFTVPSSCASVSCDTCKTSPCPGYSCTPMGLAVTSTTMHWDGSYNVTSSCGAGTSCVAIAFAPRGKYTATFCATPGTLISDGGVAHCTNTGPAKCGSVAFDLPSNTTVKGTVGP